MPRGGNRARRTNWSGRLSTTGGLLVGAGASGTVTLLDFTGSDEIATYMEPTLTRVRGWIGIDPEATLQAGGSYWSVLVCLVAAQQAPYAIDTESEFSSDSILWTYLYTMSYNVGTGASAGSGVLSGSINHVIPVDIRAQRVCDDDMRVWLSVASLNSSDGVKVQHALRFLLKE